MTSRRDAAEAGTPVQAEEPVAASPDPAPDAPPPAKGGGRRGRRRIALGVGLVVAVALGWIAFSEARTSRLQARYLSGVASELGYAVTPGASERIRFPGGGPYDIRLGYTRIPTLVDRLEKSGFRVVEQATVTPRFASLVDRGLFPVYDEKSQAGIQLLDRSGRVVFRSLNPERVYASFDSIPDPIRATLLFIESREFLDPRFPSRNPAVEWDRLARAVMDLGLRRLGSERNVPGASTLATQIEKFRHSPAGITGGAGEKLRQMATASVRAYRTGEYTLEAQRQIVLDFLNSVPLAAIPDHGEVTGIGDGLWAWYGADFDQTNRLLRADPDTLDEEGLRDRRRAYRQVVGLLLAHRRPTYYLARSEGREDLDALIDRYLRLLHREGAVPEELALGALREGVPVQARAPERPRVSFVRRKAANAIRSRLLNLLDVPQLYELDRFDLTVRTTLDQRMQDSIGIVLERLKDPAYVREQGFNQFRMLDRGDPSRVVYSFTLNERTPSGNVVRVQTDNFDAPFNVNESTRLELGSTAKLRTLVSYLEIIEEVHQTLAPLSRDSLQALQPARQDRLTAWVRDRLLADPDASLRELLDAAMERRYSANPGERFVTGGGTQVFSNFDNTYDSSILTVREGFRQSVNLVSVRTMRDIVNYYMFNVRGASARVLEDVDDPARREYLERFADQEGREFQMRFHRRYRDVPSDSILDALVRGRRLGPQRMAWAYRTVAPDQDLAHFRVFLRSHIPDATLSESAIEDVYERADPEGHILADQGYLASIHPLELWVARYLREHPGAPLQEVLDASSQARQDVYRWLFRTSRRNAQDRRIRSLLEIEAFTELHRRWAALGYPFDHLVPSYGTSIGSSGDRPAALAQLVGILLNDGVRMPAYQVESLRFAPGTPYETYLERTPVEGVRVMSPEVAAVTREALVDVVQNGTGRRVAGAVTGPGGQPVTVGGKTGTGDNRFRVFAPGGRLVSSRAINRTATFAFFVGDRYYGVVTAYVPGPEAENYGFTSSLPLQIFRTVGPLLSYETEGLSPPLAEDPVEDGPGEGAGVGGAADPAGAEAPPEAGVGG